MSVIRKMFGKYLLLTNTVSCGVMMAVGDMMQQRSDFLKRHLQGHNNNNNNSPITTRSSSSSSVSEELIDQEFLEYDTSESLVKLIGSESTLSNKEENFDYVRTRNMTAVGLIQGPFHHYFYAVLEKYLPGRSTMIIFKKTMLDQAIASPTCLGIFFFGLGALENKNLNDINGEVKLKLFDTWKVDCMFWPPSQFINFLLVPVRYRVMYINFMTMIYDMFLSYMKYDAEC